MGIQISNDADLNNALISDLNMIIDSVSKKMLEKLEKSIDKTVYKAYKPRWYVRNKRNGGLLGNWERLPNVIMKNRIKSVIRENDPTQMVHDADAFIHGSNYWEEGDDVRGILADIVTHLGRSAGPLFGDGPWRSARDFWTPIANMIKDGTVDAMIEKEFRAIGLQYRKI